MSERNMILSFKCDVYIHFRVHTLIQNHSVYYFVLQKPIDLISWGRSPTEANPELRLALLTKAGPTNRQPSLDQLTQTGSPMAALTIHC